VEEVIEGFSEEEILKWKSPEIRTNPISTK
jgi:hypothetical protein